MTVNVQVGVFSATLPPEALEITRKFMNKPVREPYLRLPCCFRMQPFQRNVWLPGTVKALS